MAHGLHIGLSRANVKGEVVDASGLLLCTLKPIRPYCEGVFGFIDLFKRITVDKEEQIVVLKRPKSRVINLLYEAEFQKKIYEEFENFGLYVVPKIYDIFFHKTTGDVMFTMDYIEGQILSIWSLANISKPGGVRLFVLFMLQLALILEVLEKEFNSDHRDLKVNNIIIQDIPTKFKIFWRKVERTIFFPFRICIIDFGFACTGGSMDVRAGDGLPPLDPCPKEGRDIFQVLASLWAISSLRDHLNTLWGAWIIDCLTKTNTNSPNARLCETCSDLSWMYSVTDDRRFSAPLCAPRKIIQDCMRALEDSL